MKCLSLRAMLFVSVVVLLFTAPAYADAFNVSSSATIFWNSLRITTDPGVTITWLSMQTEIFGAPTLSIDSWGSLSSTQHSGGLTISAVATPDILSTDIACTDTPSLCSVQETISRTGTFQATGSGNVTFALDYSLALNRSVDASSLPYRSFDSAAGSIANLILIPVVAGSSDEVRLPPGTGFTEGSVSDSVFKSGTLSAQELVSNGGTYSFFSEEITGVSIAAVEPSSLLLLATGLAGLIAMKFR